MVFHLCWCLSFPLFSHETSLFISAGGSLHGADEAVRVNNELSGQERSCHSSSQPRTADFNSEGCTGITTAQGGREELALEPCCAQLLGLNKSAGFILTQLQTSLVSSWASFTLSERNGHLQQCYRCLFPKELHPLDSAPSLAEYPLTLMGSLWDQCGLEYLSAGSYIQPSECIFRGKKAFCCCLLEAFYTLNARIPTFYLQPLPGGRMHVQQI